jgi:hypothetical protein
VIHSKALEALHEWRQSAYLNSAESRIHHLYEWLKRGIKPWEWDHDNYADRPEAIGFFFPEDIENIKQIDYMEITRNNRESKAKR